MPKNCHLKKVISITLKYFHHLLTILLLLVVFVWSLKPIQHYFFPVKERLYLKKEILKDFWLYEIISFGNAKKPDLYSYYFAENIKDNPIPTLEKEDPFLRGNIGEANISFIETDKKGYYFHILVEYSGIIFLFENEAVASFSNTPRDILLSLKASYPILNTKK